MKNTITVYSFFLLFLMSCQPYVPVGHQSQNQVREGSTTIISLKEYKPNDLTINQNKLEFDEYFVNNIAQYNFKNSLEIANEDLTFDISLTQSSIMRSDYYGYPVVFEFLISNKTDEPIKIKWDEVSYIDEGGIAHKVIKEGVRLVDRNKPTGDVVIPPMSKVQELIFPADAIYYKSSRPTGWRSAPLVESIGKNESVTIFMPVLIRDKVINYSFTFEAKDKI